MSGPRLETARLVLRPPEPDDAPAIYRGFANLNVVRMLDNPPWPYALADAEAFVADARAANAKGEAIHFAITHESELIGMIGVRARDGAPYLGYWIAEPHWGRGYATEAGRALIRHFFATRPDPVLGSGALMQNPASITVLRKLGFEVTGRGTFHSRIGKATLPNVNVALTRDRFRELYA